MGQTTPNKTDSLTQSALLNNKKLTSHVCRVFI